MLPFRLVLALTLPFVLFAAYIGGFRPLANPNDQSFLNALAYLKQQHPEIATWNLHSAAEQVVSGMNYRIEL